MEAKTTQSRTLEIELKKSQETQERREKTIEQQEKMIERLNDERERAETEVLQLRAKRNEVEKELSNQKNNATHLREELAEIQAKLYSAQSEITQLKSKIEKASVGQTLYERYDLIRHLRSSETGEEYKVYDKNLDRAVTLKVLPSAIATDKRELKKLTDDVELLVKLSHINTIRLYDFVMTNEPYIVTEYIEGRTFRQVIDTDAPLPLDRAIDYVEQICKGLSYAHNQNIHHHNLNPEHLMLTDDEFVKIMDFGMAATIRLSMARMSGKVSTEMLCYLSPEQIHGNRQIDGRSDIYSLGIIFYEMLSGQPPFTGENVIEQHIRETPRPIAHVPPEINCILQKCLEKKTDDRYAHIDELRDRVGARSLQKAATWG